MQEDSGLFSVIYGTIRLFLILLLTIGLQDYITVKLLDYGNNIYHSVLKSSGHEKDYQSKDYDRWISLPGNICRKIWSGIQSFSVYPCHELHGRFNEELVRASTFAEVYQVLLNRGLCTLLLAEDGFYYIDENIVCCCCGMRFCLSDLKDGDRITHASGCSAHKGRIFVVSHSQPPSEQPDPVNISVKLKQPTTNLVLASPDHELLSARIASFDNQSWATTERVEMLARNALFCTGVNDQVRCFACGMLIFASYLEDSTFSVHQVHAASCPFANRTV